MINETDIAIDELAEDLFSDLDDESLSENGFDVFIVVYLAVLHLVYHYLMRWYIKTEIQKLKEKK